MGGDRKPPSPARRAAERWEIHCLNFKFVAVEAIRLFQPVNIG